MHETGETPLYVSGLFVRDIERLLPVRAAALPTDEWQRELANADHSNVAKSSAELLGVLENVRRCRQRRRRAGEIGPAAHEARAIHVDERVRHVQVFGDQLKKEC